MDAIPDTTAKRTSYENIVAECPHCSTENNFNRATDLETFQPIAEKDVRCQEDSCGTPFRIVGDSINPAYQMLLLDCTNLREEKRYMACILNIAQAYEMFFALYFRVTLLCRPFGNDENQDLKRLNELSVEMSKKLRRHAFGNLRALFLSRIIKNSDPTNLADAAVQISHLPQKPQSPKNSAISAIPDPMLVPLMRAIKTTEIPTIRNAVVHKGGYRPKLKDVEAALSEAKKTLMRLHNVLDLKEDLNFYFRRS